MGSDGGVPPGAHCRVLRGVDMRDAVQPRLEDGGAGDEDPGKHKKAERRAVGLNEQKTEGGKHTEGVKQKLETEGKMGTE